MGFFFGYISFFLAVIFFTSSSTVGLGIGKIRSAADDEDEKMVKIVKKITLILIKIFINLR